MSRPRFFSDKQQQNKYQEYEHPLRLNSQQKQYENQTYFKNKYAIHNQDNYQVVKNLNTSFESQLYQIRPQASKRTNQMNVEQIYQFGAHLNQNKNDRNLNLNKYNNQRFKHPETRFQEVYRQQNFQNDFGFYKNKQPITNIEQSLNAQEISFKHERVQKQIFSIPPFKFVKEQRRPKQEFQKIEPIVKKEAIKNEKTVEDVDAIHNQQKLNQPNQQSSAPSYQLQDTQNSKIKMVRLIDISEQQTEEGIPIEFVNQQQEAENNYNQTSNIDEDNSQRQKSQNSILDSNISILKTFYITCYQCSMSITSVCIQTPCQHSFHQNCIQKIMENSLKRNVVRINCLCTEKLPQYFIRNQDQKLFENLLQNQLQKIKEDNKQSSLQFEPSESLKNTPPIYENRMGVDIFKCGYFK